MQAPRNMFSTTEIRRQLSTRQGTFVLAAVVTVAAAAFLLIFLSQYRARVTDSSEVNVMVASSLIENGSSGDVIVEKSLFQMDKVQKSELKANAVTDPAKLRGQVASEDVFPGEQFTASQFKSGTNTFAEKITGVERGISIPLDSAHGMIGDIKTGDRVDVLGGFNATSGFRGRPSLRMILRDALVLKAPDKASSSVALNKTQNVVVRTSDSKAAEIAFAVDNGKVWLTLRPKAGAENSPQELIRLEQLLAGTRPIKVNREEGR